MTVALRMFASFIAAWFTPVLVVQIAMTYSGRAGSVIQGSGI